MPTNQSQDTSTINNKVPERGAWTHNTSGEGRLSWQSLPQLNQFFFATAFGCLGIGFLSLVGPPLAASTEAAIFPYTSAGKRQTCLSNLEVLGRAFALYAQDNEGRFPLIQQSSPLPQAGTPQDGRRTWVTILQPYASSAGSTTSTWVCPMGSTPKKGDSSAYGLNPVLGGERPPHDEEEDTGFLLLSDRGTLDDLSLLPPLPGWSVTSRETAPEAKATKTNIAFRHKERAAGVFADGHVATLSLEDAGSLALWGGPFVVEAGVRRVSSRDSASGALVKRLRAGDVTGAAQLFGQRTNAAALAQTTQELQALWTLNWQKSDVANSSAYLASDEVEALGWHLARAQQKIGNDSVRAALDAQTRQRSDEEHARVGAAGWQIQSASNNLKVEVPAGWVWNEQNEGRYHTASARSPLPGLWYSLERGERTAFTPAIPVDWRASEKRLRAKYGSGYKRLRMEAAVLLGRPAGLWEYELEKPGSPRLRKRYVGTADGWNSYVFSFTTPANCFEAWSEDYSRAIGSLSLS